MSQEPEVPLNPNEPRCPDSTESSEQLLIDRVKQGDRAAFRKIVEDNKVRMYQVARSVLINKEYAEDVVQEAFIKAYRALPEFRNNASLATWLHRITFLTAIDFRRREKRNPTVEINTATMQNQIAARNSNEQYDIPIESKELRREINRVIQLLTPLEQSVFTLRHFQSFKIKDIAMIVERSEGTVKNILFRAIRKLRKELHELNDLAVIEGHGGYRSC